MKNELQSLIDRLIYRLSNIKLNLSQIPPQKLERLQVIGEMLGDIIPDQFADMIQGKELSGDQYMEALSLYEEARRLKDRADRLIVEAKRKI